MLMKPFGRTTLFDDMERLFDGLTPLSTHVGLGTKYAVSNDENQLELALDVPGRTKQDLELNLEEGVLTISGKTEVLGQKREIYQRFSVPSETDMDNVSATVENGLLLLSLPKIVSARKKLIPIE